jgi:hypothetical protein
MHAPSSIGCPLSHTRTLGGVAATPALGHLELTLSMEATTTRELWPYALVDGGKTVVVRARCRIGSAPRVAYRITKKLRV